MKRIANLLLLVWVSIAVEAASPDGDATIIVFENDEYHIENGHGVYKYRYETSNGIQREEEGYIEDPTDPNAELVVKGFYSYLLPNGEVKKVSYASDSKGYREGDGKSAITPSRAPAKPAEPGSDFVLPELMVPTLSAKRIGSNVLASLAGGGIG